MAGKRIEVQLGINADVASAKKSIKDLETSLSKLYQMQTTRGFSDFGINKAVEGAQKLEQSLRQALNVDTGKLDLSKFSSSLKQAGTSLTELNTQFLQAGTAGQQVFLSLANSIAQAEVPLKKTSRLVQEFSRTLKNTISYQLSASMFNAVTGALHDAVSYTKNLNGSLNEIRIVTGQSAEQMAKFAQSANAAAKQLSTTTNNYAKASLIFYQQGLSDADVKKRTDAVIKMANVTKESADDVSSYMTAIWNNFDDGSKSLERYADVMTALGAATASSTKEIAAGLEKFASIGKTIGLSYEYATSAVATIVDKTRQSAETVGTGLRTIFSRLQGLSLGETLEDGVDLNKYSTALKTVGVNILDAAGNMRDMDAILESLAGKWQNLSNAQKTALAQTVGGVRQYTTLISLMDNWDSMEQNLNTANTSAGSLQKQQDIYAESWEAASQRSQAAIESLYQTLLNDKGFITIINGLTGVTNAVTYLVDALGGLPGILGMVGMIGTKVFSQQIGAGLESSLTKLALWGSQFKGSGVLGFVKKIGSGDTKSAAQMQAANEAKKAAREYGKQMNDLAMAGKKDSSAYYAAEAAQDLLRAKTDLLDVENKLSDIQKKNAQSQIDLMGKQQQALLDLKQEKEQAAKDDKLQANRDVRAVLNSASYQHEEGGYYRSDDEQARAILGGSYTGSGNVNSLLRLREKSANAKYRSDMAAYFTDYANNPEADLANLRAGINGAFGKGTISNTASLEEIKKKLAEITAQAQTAEKEVQDVIKTAGGSTETQAALRNLMTSGQNSGEARSSREVERWNRENSLRGTRRKFRNAIDPNAPKPEGEEDPEAGQKKAKAIADGVQKAAQAVAAVTAGISQAQSAMETFGDSAASTGDKIAAGMSVASGAMTSFATGGWLGLIAYGVGAIGTVVYDAIDKAYRAEEIAAEKAEASALMLANSYKEVKKAYEDTVSTVNSYETASKNMDQLVTGTDEWKKALIEANEAALKLIKNFKLIQGSDYTLNPDGSISFTKEGQAKIDQGQSDMLQDTLTAQSTANMAEAQAASARAKAQQDKVAKSNDKGRWATAAGSAVAGAAGGAMAAAGIGAAIGSIWPVIGNAIGGVVGLIAGGLIGGVASGLTALWGYDKIKEQNHEEEKAKMDKLAKAYIASGKNEEKLREMAEKEFEGESDSFIESIMNVVQATVDAEEQMQRAMELAAQSVLNANEAYQNARDEEAKRDVSARATKAYQEAYDAAASEFDESVEDEDKREQMQLDYLEGMQLLDKNGLTYTFNDDGSMTYSYIGADGHRTQQFEVSAADLKTYTASAAAQASVDESTDEWVKIFTDMRSGSAGERAMAAFGGQGLNTATREEFNALNEDYQTYFTNLAKTNPEALKALGFDSAEAAIAAFEEAVDGEAGIAKAWEDALEGISDFDSSLTDKMSLDTAQKFTNAIKDLSTGPLANVGEILNEGLTTAFAEANVKEEDKAGLLAQIADIDWNDYDAFDQFNAIFESMGYSIDETSDYWIKFTADMRKAGTAVPDFAKLKNNLTAISKITKDLKLGDIISEEDYKTLIAYNDAWADLFMLQADGSRKFIGDAEAMRTATQQMALDQKELLNTYKEVSEIDAVSQFNWDNETREGAGSEFKAIYDENAALQAMLAEAGYDAALVEKIVAEASTGNTERLATLFDFIQNATDPAQMAQQSIELEEIIASTATDIEQLQSMLDSGVISEDTYTKALISMASGYEYCAEAIKEYREALASGDQGRIEEAEEALAKVIELEQEAAKHEGVFEHALSGKGSMSVEDLTTLSELDPSLYNKYLTASDDEWYEASYQAYSEWLDARIAGYPKDSAAYKALTQEKIELDREYYETQQEKALSYFNGLTEKYDEQIEKITSAQDSLSDIFDSDSAPTFTQLGELRRELLDLGYDVEQVDNLIKNLGKVDSKNKSKDDILAEMGAETELLLKQLTETAGMKNQYQKAIGVHITDYSFGPAVPNDGENITPKAYSHVQIDPNQPSDIPGLTWENDQYNFSAAGAGDITITGTKGKGIKEVTDTGIVLDDVTGSGGEIAVNATEGSPLAVELTESGWVVKDATGSGAGSISVSGSPNSTTGVTFANGKWVLTNVNANGQSQISVSGLADGTTGVKYENNAWQLTSTTATGAEATISVASDGGGNTGVDFDGTNWKISGETVGGGSASIAVSSNGGTKGVTFDGTNWKLSGATVAGKTGTITVKGDSDPSTGVDYTDAGWVISGTVNGEETSITVSGNPDGSTVTGFSDGKYTIAGAGEGSGTLQIDAAAFDGATIDSYADGVYHIAGIGQGSGSITVSGVPDGTTVELVKGENGGYVLKNVQSGESLITVSAEQAANGAKIRWNGTAWVIDQTIEQSYKVVAGSTPETEVYQTVHVSYIDEEAAREMNNNLALRRTVETLNYGQYTQGTSSDFYNPDGRTHKYFSAGTIDANSTTGRFLTSLYGDSSWTSNTGTGKDDYISLAMGALKYSRGAGGWLQDFGHLTGRNGGTLAAEYKMATEEFGEELDQTRRSIITDIFSDDFDVNNNEYGIDETEWTDLTDKYTAAYNKAISEMGMGATEAAQYAAQSITSELMAYMNEDSTYVMGMNLYQGLINGWNDAGFSTTTFADTALNILGDLMTAFEMNSPSRATKRMGQWLMEGLNIGWASTEFDENNIGSIVLGKINESLQTAFGELNSEWSDINFLEYLETDENGNFTKLLPEDQLIAMGKAKVGEQFTDFANTSDQIDIIGSLFNTDGVAGYSVQELDNLVKELPEEMQAAIQERLDNGEQLTFELVASVIPAESQNQLLQDFLFGDSAGDAIKSFIASDYLTAIEDPVTRGIFAAAKEAMFADESIPINCEADITTDNAQQAIDYIFNYIQEHGDEYSSQMEAIIDTMLDKWSAGLATIYEKETAYASQMVELWTNTYKTIAKIRIALLEDPNASVLATVGDDITTMGQLITNARQNMGDDFDPNELFSLWYNGGLPDTHSSLTSFTPPTEIWALDQYGAVASNFRFNNGLVDTSQTWTEFDTAQTTWYNDFVQKNLGQVGSIQEGLDSMYAKVLEGDAQTAAVVDMLISKGVITVQKDENDNVTGYAVADSVGIPDGMTIADFLKANTGISSEADFYSAQNALLGYEFTARWREGDLSQQRNEAILGGITDSVSLLTKAATDKNVESYSLDEQAELYRLLNIDPESMNFADLLDLSGIIESVLGSYTHQAQSAGNLGVAEYYLAGQGYVNVNGQWRQYDYDPNEQVMGADNQMHNRWQTDEYGQLQEYNAQTGQYETASIESLTVEISGADLLAALQSGGFTANLNEDGTLNVTDVGENTIPGESTLNDAAAGKVGAQADYEVYSSRASEAGFTDIADLDDYANSLAKVNKVIGENEHLSGAMLNEWRDIALQAKKVEDAWDSLSSSGKSNVAVLRESKQSSIKYRNAMKALQKDLKTIFGDAEEITDDFVREHLDDIEKMAEGDEAAAERVEKALIEDIMGQDYNINFKVGDVSQPLGDVIRQFDDTWAHLENGAVITPEIDQSGITAGLLDIVNNFDAASASAIEAMSAIGYNPVVEMIEVPLQDRMSGSGQVTVPKVDFINGMPVVTSETRPITAEEQSSGVLLIPSINSENKPKITGFQKTGGGSSSTPSTGRRGGGGGGGGSREARRANHVKKEDYVERYHEIDNVIDDLADAYERLNEQEDRAWGKNRIDAMKAQTAIIEKQVAATEEKIRQAEKYLKIDKKAAEAAGWLFDENGNVMNYDELMGKQVDKYNAAIDAYNNMSAGEQEKLDEKWSNKKNADGEYYSGYEDYLKQTLLDGPKEALDQYEETMELLEDLGMDYDEFLNAWHDNILGQIQTKLDTTLEVTEAQLEYLDHKLSRISDDAYKTAEALTMMAQQMEISSTQFDANKSALNDLLQAYNENWTAEGLMNGDISIDDLVSAGMESGDIELLQNIMSGLMDASAQMSEQMVNSIESMANAFDEFNSDMDRYISTIEHAQTITSTYRNIIDLTGRTMSGFNSSMLKSINDATVAQAKANLSANKTKYDTVKVEYEEAKKAYEAAQASYAEGGIDAAALKAAKDTYQSAQDNMNEAQESFLSSWEAALQAAADAFQSNMEAAMRDVGEMMSGHLAGGLAELEDQFAKLSEQDQNYVDDYEKIYQLTKMTRDLTDKIDNTSNIRAQKELLKYQKEINGLLESDQQMSQYDIDYLRKKIDLKMAEIALDEAQNAKSQVTMRRDSEGNYNYVYTADENAVEKAESEYTDKLYEMQKANDEYITSLSQNMASLSSQMLSEIAAIDTTIYDTEEKYQAEVQRITDHYTNQMAYYNEEMNKVLGNNKTLYEQDWTNFSKYTGYKLSAEENYVTKWNQTVLSQVTGFETQEGFYQNFNEAIFGSDPAHPSSESLIGKLVTAYVAMRQQINEANEAAGVDTEDLASTILGNIQAATDEAEQAATDITNAANQIVTQITSIGSAVTTMVNNYSDAMEQMEAETDAMLGVLLDFLAAYGEIGDLDIDPGILAEINRRRQERQNSGNPASMDTGGYTGSWGSEGRLALLHQKELVLNASDTANMLASVGILRQIANVIDLNALASSGGFGHLVAGSIGSHSGTLQQEVHIEANFPNATDKNQIEDAFKDIVNLAAQFANR